MNTADLCCPVRVINSEIVANFTTVFDMMDPKCRTPPSADEVMNAMLSSCSTTLDLVAGLQSATKFFNGASKKNKQTLGRTSATNCSS